MASAKSALDEATARYNAAMKVVKEEQAADSKAQQAVATAEKNVERARKAFIAANDKLAAARSNGKAALAETQAKIAGKSCVCRIEYICSQGRQRTLVSVYSQVLSTRSKCCGEDMGPALWFSLI